MCEKLQNETKTVKCYCPRLSMPVFPFAFTKLFGIVSYTLLEYKDDLQAHFK